MCREPNKKLSAKKALPRAFYLTLGTEKTLGKQASLPRAKQKALGTEKHSSKISFPRANWLALSKEFLCQVQFSDSRQRKFKKSLFCLQFFSIINIHLYKTYAQIWHNFSSICYICKCMKS
jgi:hypothetical protein